MLIAVLQAFATICGFVGLWVVVRYIVARMFELLTLIDERLRKVEAATARKAKISRAEYMRGYRKRKADERKRLLQPD